MAAIRFEQDDFGARFCLAWILTILISLTSGMPGTASAQVLPQAGLCDSGGYNLISFGRANLANSSTQAPILARDLGVLNYGISSGKTGSSIDYAAVIGTGQFASAQFFGRLAANNFTTADNVTVFNASGQSGQLVAVQNDPAFVTRPYPFNFDALESCMTQCSSTFDDVRATGAVTMQFGQLRLSRADPGSSDLQYYFRVTAEQLDSASSVDVEPELIQAGARLIIDVSGSSVRFDNMGFPGSLNGGNVLWNFANASSVEISNIGVPGTVLAPRATVYFRNGNIDGTLIARSVRGDPGDPDSPATGSLTYRPYTGTCGVPPPPVFPRLECVARNGASQHTAYWGYLQPFGGAQEIPLGPNNNFDPVTQNQPTTFLPGRRRFVFSTDFVDGSIVWNLAGNTATASTSSEQRCMPRCLIGSSLDLEVCTLEGVVDGSGSGTLNNSGTLSSFAWSTDCPGNLVDADTLRPRLQLSPGQLPPDRPIRCSINLTVTDDTRFGSSDPGELRSTGCATAVTIPACRVDCAGTPNGTAQVDVCGVCGGDGTSCLDCAGVPGGGAVIDQCGVCGGSNDSCLDCRGVPNGGAVPDTCGICGGDGSACVSSSCTGIVDACGVCGGDASTCVDCAGIPNGGTAVDVCGACGGNGSSCSQCFTPSIDDTDNNGQLTRSFSLLIKNAKRYVNEALRCPGRNTARLRRIKFLLSRTQVSTVSKILSQISPPSQICSGQSCNVGFVGPDLEQLRKLSARILSWSITGQRAGCRDPIEARDGALTARELNARIRRLLRARNQFTLHCR